LRFPRTRQAAADLRPARRTAETADPPIHGRRRIFIPFDPAQILALLAENDNAIPTLWLGHFDVKRPTPSSR
jgi:hypothetical protein